LGLIGLTLPAQAVLWLPWLSLAWTVKMVQWSASLPGASLEIFGYGSGGLLLTYAGLFAVANRRRMAGWSARLGRRLGALRWPSWGRWVAGPTGVGLMGAAAILVWSAALAQPDGYLHVHFLDVGQGDGIFIQTPSGRQVLVDGGLSPQMLYSELGAVMPFWDRSLDLVIASHPDGDHIGAQEVLPQRFHIERALDSIPAQASADGEAWRTAMASAGVAVDLQSAGGWIDLGDGAALWVLWPTADGTMGEESDNENSLVVRLVYGAFSVLLTGDAGIPAETDMLAAGEPVASTVLKAGHHGSRHSTGEAFVQAVDPSLVVIQVGENRYGHPTDEVLVRLTGRRILRNDHHGRIHLRTDGRLMWVLAERGKGLN
jgi:competence protein ComEC